jgi:hypothetical protein
MRADPRAGHEPCLAERKRRYLDAMSRSFVAWSREELEAVAMCLRADLRTAGPRFSIEFAPLSPHVRRITSVPPSDEVDIAVPGCGGFIEGGGLLFEDWDAPEGVEQLPDHVKQLMGSMHVALGEPADTSIVLKVDGAAAMWLVFWSAQDHAEQLADLLYQAQDVVMETTTEMWPPCPSHDHFLRPERAREWVTWTCPENDESVARFGELGSQGG